MVSSIPLQTVQDQTTDQHKTAFCWNGVKDNQGTVSRAQNVQARFTMYNQYVWQGHKFGSITQNHSHPGHIFDNQCDSTHPSDRWYKQLPEALIQGLSLNLRIEE